MIGSGNFGLWRRLSKTQIGLIFATVLLVIGGGILSLNVYLNILATNTAFQAGYLITDLTDIERAILFLRRENQAILNIADPDFAPVELRRGLLTSQMRLAFSESPDRTHLIPRFQEMQQILDEYNLLLATARENPTEANLAEAGPMLEAMLDELERKNKALINQEETAFFSTIGNALTAQRTTQRSLLILSALIIIFGGLLVLSLQRTVSGEFAHAYALLQTEVGERRQTEKELRAADHELRGANANLKALNTRLQEEVILARKIQQSLLLPPRPNWGGLDVVCYSIPASGVGGDFYAYQARSDGRFALAVGDVSGKGVSAALLMATSLAHFDSVAETALPPSELLCQLDQSLAQYTGTTRQNCALCYVEIEDLTLQVVNAGCVPPYIRHRNGEVDELDVGGAPLGLGLGAEDGYTVLTVDLAPGDQVILTSDGVVEAHVTADKLFGFNRLKQTIAQGPSSNAQAMLDHLRTQITAFMGGLEFPDDVTIVILQV